MQGQRFKVLIWSNSRNECIRIKRLLSTEPDVQIVGEASAEAVSMNDLTNPDVTVFASNFDRVIDFHELEEVCKLSSRTLVISETTDENKIWRAFACGIDGYCLHDIQQVKLVEGLRTVASGQAWLDERLLRSLIKHLGDAGPQSEPGSEALPLRKLVLSAKEMHVLYLVSEGLDTRQIAQLLSEPEESVTSCMEEILKKMSAGDPKQPAGPESIYPHGHEQNRVRPEVS